MGNTQGAVRVTADDFEVIQLIGKGAFGKVPISFIAKKKHFLTI